MTDSIRTFGYDLRTGSGDTPVARFVREPDAASVYDELMIHFK
ncbi:MAG: hypothetical protein V2A56_10495 [bacterium]